MKNHLLIFKIILLLVICATLNSCLSVDRKIKINIDGSGEETMKITFMKEFYSMMSSMSSLMDSSRRESYLDSLYNDEVFLSKTKSEFDSLQGIDITDVYSQRNPDSSSSFIIKYKFDNIVKIGSSLEKAIDDNGDGEKRNPTIVKMNKDGDEVVFDYLYEQKKSDEALENDSLNEEMRTGIAKMFGNGFINFEIEFPYEVISSNATSSDKNTLIWNFPMPEVFMNSKMHLEARMKE